MPYLEIVDGIDVGRKVEIEGEITIGRAPANELCLPDNRASRKHASLTIENNQVMLRDLGSANGTFLNRSRINPEVPHALKSGDEVVICGTRMLFRAEPSRRRTGEVPGPGTGAAPSTLSMIMTGDDDSNIPAVNASLDASISMIDIREEEKESTHGLMEAIKRLQAMVKVSGELGMITDQDELLQRIMRSIFDIFPQADRAYILLHDKASGELAPVAGRQRDSSGSAEDFAVSRTIIKTVVEEKRSILTNDAQDDDRFGAQQSIVDLSIRALMCAPFIFEDDLLGIINVDTMSRLESFTSDDLAMLTGIAAQAAIALKAQDLLHDIERESALRAQISKYMSPDVVEAVTSGTIPLQLGAETKRGTLFFCDVIGFTSMSEKMTAVEVVDKLNRYFSVTTEIVTRNKGTLHKFIGDMIMAFWNVLLPDDNAEYNAARAGLEMQTAVWSFNQELIQHEQAPIHLGVGINTGDFAGGNIGGDSIEYTIIGDNVNLGQRIESMAGRWKVFVSEATFCPIAEMASAIKLPPAMVKGKSMPIQIYSMRGLQTGSDEMTLDIPADIKDASGAVLGHGILDRATGLLGELQLFLNADTELPEGQDIQCVLDVPELTEELLLTATVDGTDTGTHGGLAHFTKAYLTNLRGSDACLQLLRPGTLLDCDRDWSEMKRK